MMVKNANFRLMVLALVFILFATPRACGEGDCYEHKDWIKRLCINSIKLHGKYEPPTDTCRQLVEAADMVCICHILKPADELMISIIKLVRLARDCGKPLPVGTKCGSK